MTHIPTDPADAPTVSAVLIVKDEEAVLERCLESVRWVDQIVVYDTGSSDRTVEIARRFTDTVVEGYWDDDFGAARNRALEHATGEWVLVVDADEVFDGDPTPIRRALGRDGAVLHSIPVADARIAPDGTREVTESLRFFRRDTFEWRGRLHEQVVAREGRTARRHRMTPLAAEARLTHDGYRAEVVAEKDKAARNLRIARAEYEAARTRGERGARIGLLHANYVRSLSYADMHLEALREGEVLHGSGDVPTAVRAALSRSLAFAAHATGDRILAERWIDRWVATGVDIALAWATRARLAAQWDDAETALDALARLPEAGSASAGHLDRGELVAVEVWALNTLGRAAEAVGVARRAVAAGRIPGLPDVVWTVFESTGQPIEDLLRALSREAWSMSAALAGRSPDEGSGRFLAAMHRVAPDDVAILTAAAARWAWMSIEEAIEWSLPIRRAGLVGLCPLAAMAASSGQDPRQRAVAAAVVWEAFEDHEVLPHLEHALSEVPVEHEAELLALLDAAAPGLVSASSAR